MVAFAHLTALAVHLAASAVGATACTGDLAPSSPVAVWGRCGGQGEPTLACASGSFCKVQNPYYSQCVPDTGSMTTTTTTTTTITTHTPPPAAVQSTTAAVWERCGGQGQPDLACASGSYCKVQNPYYSQCVPDTGSMPATTTTAPPPPPPPPAATPPTSPGTPAAPAPSGAAIKSSFTMYGSGDDEHSGYCQVTTTACGFFTTGYNAAVSQNEFGVGPGAGAGPACGGCWKLTAMTDSTGNALSNAGNSIVVQITNLCPASGNPLCSQNGPSGTNQYGAHLNFDLCMQSGASAALFGNSGVGLAVGTAEKVSCSGYRGDVQH